MDKRAFGKNIFTVEKQATFLELLRTGNTISHACEVIGVSHDAVEKYRRKNPEYNEEVIVAREVQIRVVEDALYQTALSGHVTAQIFFLVNRTKYRPRNEKWENLQSIKHNVSSEVKMPTPIDVSLAELSDEEMATLDQLLRKLYPEPKT